MSNLRKQLSEFLGHEVSPIESILTGHTLLDVLQEIDSIVRSAEQEAAVRALGFLRDACLYPHSSREAFRSCVESSEIWESLRGLLRVPDFVMRRNAVYTIGKLTFRERACLLVEVFPFYLESDPINLPDLLQECFWLTGDWNWGLVDQVANADHYLKRWSLCQMFDDSNLQADTSNRSIAILERLKGDSHPNVVAEAYFRFERISVKLRPKLLKAEWRKEAKRISDLKPRITFQFAAHRFMHDRTDYTLEEFDHHVAALV